MSGLLGSIPTSGHAAPTARAPVSAIEEQKGASRAFAGLHLDEVFITDEIADSPCNREEEGVRRAPASQ